MNKTNKSMENILVELKRSSKALNCNNIAKAIYSDFYEIEGCILLDKGNKIENLNIDRILKAYKDRTGYEASYNEVRINDHLDTDKYEKDECLALALQTADGWAKYLKSKFLAYAFHIIIVQSGDFVTLRCYKFREEEGSWVDIDNLDNYKDEAVLVMAI